MWTLESGFISLLWSLFAKCSYSSWITDLLRECIQRAPTLLCPRANPPVRKCLVKLRSRVPRPQTPDFLCSYPLPLPHTSEQALHRFGSPITDVLSHASPWRDIHSLGTCRPGFLFYLCKCILSYLMSCIEIKEIYLYYTLPGKCRSLTQSHYSEYKLLHRNLGTEEPWLFVISLMK